MNEVMTAALEFAEMGYCVIPIKPDYNSETGKFDKKPYVDWKIYQTTFSTKMDIEKWWTQWPKAMIGILTGAVSKTSVIDCDSPEAYQYIQDQLPDSFLAPIATTPRGGKHIWYRSNGTKIINKANIMPQIMPKIDSRGDGGYIIAPPSVNEHGQKYEWLEGLSLKEVAPQGLPDALLMYFKEGGVVGGGYKNSSFLNLQNQQTLQFLQDGERDQDIFHMMNCLAKGGFEKELAYKVVDILGNYCNPPFPFSEGMVKVDSAYGRKSRSEKTVAQNFRDYCSLQDSYINLTDAYETLQFLQAPEKAACQVAAHRMCKEGILEKISRGCFKKIEHDCADIDVFSPIEPDLDIKYPLGIHDLIKTLPKNIIVVAGEPNSGKTAYLLNFAKMNMGKTHEVIYFSSEMGPAELQARLRKFNMPMEDWRKVIWKERAADFSQMVRPNAINIIDFLEVHEDFFKVGLFIKQIFDKLDKGIAFIALQKNKGRDEGMGGMRSLEKARLYLAMEPGKIKIVKGKNWRDDEINPNGLSRRYKLGGGHNFVVEKNRFGSPVNWEKE